jgi:sirohydrochlorin cobaltochelatase
VKASLLLVGHGSARYADAADPMRRHAEMLRATDMFAEVEIGVLNGDPPVAEALSRIAAPVVHVVPYFMEDGFFSQVATPLALGGRPCHIGPPIGVHGAMPRLIARQATEACRTLGIAPGEAALLVTGHGSATKPGRALALHRHGAQLLAEGRFATVRSACLEEAPFVADALSALRPYPVIVIGFFANHGSHVRDDLPALIATEQAQRGGAGPCVIFAASVVDDAALTRIIIDHAYQADRQRFVHTCGDK